MDYDKVVGNLRAVLLSSKGGVPINEINQDFKIIIGESIPYHKLGYQSLEAFLRSISGIKITNKDGKTYVEALPNEKSCHLSKLVSRQKTRKKSRKSFHQNSMPRRIPRLTKRVINSGRNRNANSSMLNKHSTRYNAGYKQEKIIPLMQVPTGYASSISSLERPRYLQATSESFTSPSKKLKDRKSNAIQMIINQNVNKCNNNNLNKNYGNGGDKSSQSAITCKTKAMQERLLQGLRASNNEKSSSSNISGRLIMSSNIPSSHSPISNNVSTPCNSEVLSPLSPAQLIANKQTSSFSSTEEPLTISVQETNQKETVLKSILVFKEDPRHQLSVCAKNFNLPEPIYRILPPDAKSPTTVMAAIYAHVKIGSYGYSNYPHDASSNDEAQKLAAKIALKDLIDKFGSLSNVTETVDKKLIQNRVKEIVNTHMNGVFKDQIPAYYNQKYGECLPAHWLNIIKECSEIALEKGADNSIILQRCKIQTEEACHSISTKSDKILLNPIESIIPGQLQLPEDQYWIVYVSYIMSALDVYVRLGGPNYSDKFDIMLSNMMEYYGRSQSPVKSVEIGGYYAIFEDDSWHRVRCEEVDSITAGLVTVSFIDHGDVVKRSLSDLYILDKMFCSLPAQAMRVCLSGLEDFRDCETALFHIENRLLGLTFYVEVLNCGFDKDGPYATVNFYDTSTPKDINLNNELRDMILDDIKASPQIKKEQVIEVLVSYVEKNGDIYIQMQTEGMKYLIGSINHMMQTGLTEDILESSTVIVVDRMRKYLVSVNGNWHRGEVANIYPNGQIKMFLIDVGETVIVNKASLLDLKSLSDLLTNFPAQAIKVHLHNIEKSKFNEKMVSRLRKLVPQGQPILIRVIDYSSVNTPLVEMFKRIQPDNMLVSIHTTLLYEELERTIGDGNNNVKLRKRITSRVATNENDDIIQTLKPPKITGIREFFDVHVTMAANPGNFTVQPLDNKQSFEAMMIELQKVCSTYQGLYPTIESIKEGNFYAAKCKDGSWYRASVMNIIDENMVTVYFCDFGDVYILSLDKLQPLESKFLELPYQAIKAKLVGIRPINKDWSVEDCIRFQKLVVEKDFVSIVIESTCDDNKNPHEIVLGLKLIDVETSEDIFIDQLLVQENRAVFID
ncbi:PREDICTED: tudor domain-containing protein 7B-like [Polistes dominula]|uniref:Tudor domain-containing protein 7B-like n=1 Tax=Polistes dominula TaxID=743375 RepID=A0ABM1J634_POLDO|nr:PREDICTED: tudor domain-containing protein 7B-like [Polistes dominula]